MKYKHRPLSRFVTYKSAYFFRVAKKPSIRCDDVALRVIKMRKMKISNSQLRDLLKTVAHKYMTNRTTEERYIWDWNRFKSNYNRITINCKSITEASPKPNTYCNRRASLKVKDVLYKWVDENGYTKIGITSSTANADRIESCAKARGTVASNISKVSTPYARVYESRLLKALKIKPYQEGDGYTEFRFLSKSQSDRLDRYMDIIEKGA